ncbi:MAG TPA: 2-C-methyl-D-erythritol 2,4-cyclodiphosphate synthase, partial [bacterium]
AAFVVRNVDATVVLEVPSLGPFKKAMGERVANALRLSRNEVSIKAKTNERFEAVGKGEAVAAFAVVLLEASGADGRP